MKAEQLRKAILQMAIQGKLVPQDPNDEPASVLLEKIHAEKQRLIKEGKIKKDKVDSVIFKGEDNRHYEKVGNNAPICIEEELPFEIPDSWEWVRLGNAFTIVMGQSPNGNSVSQNCNGIEFHQGKICFGEKYLRVSKQKTTMPTKIIKEDAVVLCVRAPVGKVNIVERTICIGRGLCAVMPFVLMPIEFIYLLLQTYEEIFNKKATGTTFKAISNEVIFNQIIPLPPLAEQSRIVAEIEKYEPLIAEYDKLEQQKSALDSEIYDKLKKSILQYAIQGKLIPQSENDEPASELLKRIRAEKKAQLGKKYVDSYIYKGDDNCYYEKVGNSEPILLENLPFEIPDSWCWARLGDMGEWGAGATPPRGNPEYYNGSILWIKTGELNNDYIYASGETLTEKALQDCSLRYNNIGDILIAMYGATIGKLGIAGVKLTTNQACCACTPYAGFYNLYLFYFLMAEKERFIKLGAGGAQPNISREKIVNHYVPLPPYREQQRIVERLKTILYCHQKDEV